MKIKRIIRLMLMKSFSFFSKTQVIITYDMVNLGRDRKFNLGGDYVRDSSLELVAEEIYRKELSGSVAELGVYQGEFAKKINIAFPDRKLFLFDTFEGFNDKDKKMEIEMGYSQANQDFSNTSIELVLKKMKYKDNCIIKQGRFPESAENIVEHFVFVSIDTDLFEPIYSGLCWFYPKMVNGGIIFIHDYNNIKYPGTKQAVWKFCNENNINFFPLSDKIGSAVIIKE